MPTDRHAGPAEVESSILPCKNQRVLASGVFSHDDTSPSAEGYRLAQQLQMQDYISKYAQQQHLVNEASDYTGSPSALHKRGSVAALQSRKLVANTLSGYTGIRFLCEHT